MLFRSVRQSVAYGIGIVAEKNREVIAPVLGESWTVLSQLASAEDSQEDENALVTQNALSAMGKILQFHSDTIDVASLLPSWVSLLPPPLFVASDEENYETTVIYKQLCHFATVFPMALLGEGNQHLPLVLAVFLDALGTSLVAEEIGRAHV